MFEALKTFFSETKPQSVQSTSSDSDPVQVAAAALLVEAALVDGTFDAGERHQIKDVLTHLFALDEGAMTALLSESEWAIAESVELYSFARTVKDALDYDRRVELMQMLWEVVYADGQLDDFEANLVRRVSGLLYVSDQDSGRARKAALEQLGLELDAGS